MRTHTTLTGTQVRLPEAISGDPYPASGDLTPPYGFCGYCTHTCTHPQTDTHVHIKTKEMFTKTKYYKTEL